MGRDHHQIKIDDEEGQATRPLLLDGKVTGADGSGSDLVDTLTKTDIDDSHITAALVLSTSVAICGSFSYGCAMGFSSPAESGIMEDLGLSIAAYSVFGSIITIGGMIGAVLSGKLADVIGRKLTMGISSIFCTLGWLTIAIAKDAWWLDIGRLLMGVGVGLVTYVVPVYVAEISPRNIRGLFTSASQLMNSVGFGLVFFFGNFISWRTLSLLGGIPCALQLVGLFFIPESPRWLAKVGREKEFEAALQRLRGKDADIAQEAIDIRDTIETFQSGSKSEGKTMELFQRRYAYPLTIGVGLMLLQQLGGSSGFSFYTCSLLAEANFPVVLGTTILAIAQFPATLSGVLLTDISGRRTLLLISAIGTCLCLSIVALSFYLKELHYLEDLTSIMAFIGVLGYGATYGIGMAGLPWVVMSEIFPVNVKASAGSLVTLTHWFCSWVTTYSFNFMMEWNYAGSISIFAAICGLTVIFIWKLVPETKGRTLEEIQATLTDFSQEEDS